MTGGGEVHVEGARGHDCMEGARGGGKVHVEGARGHDWRRRGTGARGSRRLGDMTAWRGLLHGGG